MRIAFHAPMKAPTHPVPSGDRRMARLLMAALELAGHEVFLASTLRTWDRGEIPNRSSRLRALGGRCAARLKERHAARPPDLWFTYHLYHKAPDWLGPPISRAFAIPYVVAEASHAPKQAAGRWAEGHAAAADAIRHASAVVNLCDHDAGCVTPLLDDPRRLFHMAPFIDTAPYLAAAAGRERHRRELSARLGWNDDSPRLLAVGMMRSGDKLESYRVLADALRSLLDRPWRLMVVGDGKARGAVAALFGGFPPGRVILAGALSGEELPACYAAADLVVWPAINEAYGMALLEARAAGAPVVAGRTGGVPDVVDDGNTGILTPIGDPTAFAVAVAALLDDPVRRATLSRTALEGTAARHDISVAARRLDDLVRRLKSGEFP